MLLRRITQHVRNQNWFAVFLDFVIVVVGVFIGLQVQQWATDKTSKADEIRLLNTLKIDMLADNALLIERIERTKQEHEARTWLVENIQDKGKTVSPTIIGEKIYYGVWRFTTFEHSQPTLDELSATASLNRIGSKALRNQIQKYLSNRSVNISDQLELVNYAHRFVDPYLNKNFELSLILPHRSSKTLGQSNWDFVENIPYELDKLNNLEFRNLLVQLTISASKVYDNFAEIQANHLQIINLIDNRLNELRQE